MQAFSGVMDLPLLPTIVGGLAFVVILALGSRLLAPRRPPPEDLAGRPEEEPREWPERLPEQITGKAYVSDGDGLKVAGQRIRLAGIDAPEQGQMATTSQGEPVDQGKAAYRVLFNKVAGKTVHVTVHKMDKYGRLIGTVHLGGRDICREMVRDGFAWATCGEQYKEEEREARQAKRGMWKHDNMIHPKQWRRENRVLLERRFGHRQWRGRRFSGRRPWRRYRGGRSSAGGIREQLRLLALLGFLLFLLFGLVW